MHCIIGEGAKPVILLNYGKLQKPVSYEAEYPQTEAGKKRLSATRLEQSLGLLSLGCHHKPCVSAREKPSGPELLLLVDIPSHLSSGGCDARIASMSTKKQGGSRGVCREGTVSPASRSRLQGPTRGAQGLRRRCRRRWAAPSDPRTPAPRPGPGERRGAEPRRGVGSRGTEKRRRSRRALGAGPGPGRRPPRGLPGPAPAAPARPPRLEPGPPTLQAQGVPASASHWRT